MDKIKLSVVIVNFNTGDFLKTCLSSLEDALKGIPSEVFVVDNASSDESFTRVQEKFKFNFLPQAENLGFARANNLAISQPKGEYVLLLNPDTKLSDDSISAVISKLDNNPEVGIATCKVVLANGQLDPASHRGFPTPWASFTYFLKLEKVFPQTKLFGQYHLTYEDLCKEHEIDSPSGAFFMIRKKVIDQIGLLDENYFMYAEDLDWAFRAKRVGWKVMYYPHSSIVHYKGISSGIKSHSHTLTKLNRESRKRAVRAFYDTMLLFYKKHMEKRYPMHINLLVKFAILAKRQIALIRLSV